MIRRPPRSTLSLHAALPIYRHADAGADADAAAEAEAADAERGSGHRRGAFRNPSAQLRSVGEPLAGRRSAPDRKRTRLNSSHSQISYAVFCLTNKCDTTLTL